MNFRKNIIASKRLVIAGTLGCVAISFPLIFAACGDDSSSSSNSNEGNGEDFAMEMEFYRAGFDVRKSLKDLDPCDDETEGAAAVVLADTSVYYCYDGKWNDKAREYILDENDPFWECSSENEGDSVETKIATAKGDAVNERYFCKDGEWVSYLGGGEVEGPRVYKGPIAHSEKGTLEDSRDGKTYKTVRIYTTTNPLNPTAVENHDQTWMAENLNYEVDSSYCYDNNSANCDKYGRLYPYNDKVCPEGWHLPSRAEWNVLFEMVGDDFSGYHLKSKKGWEKYISHYGRYAAPVYAGEGDDKFGFTVLPGGYMESAIDGDGNSEEFYIEWDLLYGEYKKLYDPDNQNFELGYFDLSTSTAFWTSSTDKPYTKYGKDDVYRVYVAFRNTYENAVFGRVFLEKNARYIRCLKD